MNKNYSLNDLSKIVSILISSVKNKTLLFYGQMGVGKTTLIKELCRQLQVEDNISSPTFSLVNEYKTASNEKVYHFDFYRITDEEEALDMGIEDYFYNNDWCLIEWPENIENLLPLDAVEIHLTLLDDGQRNIQLK
ncbi:tRNA (adenosine(37)-N6)-threonylcarbamoyltransferase complex ATPase subunit type 1 TsaE [Polaribacter porphyrae]|uniref:tRNA threonylcarbamoyladenosine biosynthesis protein TsaE n=1 Tax=Polaribacter porphyrae TaxID=1137780 RepID=A0A2S7WK88_9FLAO|nr:tRNA (adenosine(37)-N6)-threonylcarbamoyltransferase complex ATPase subunit type 1 TsaE [Polaribacter porphyrae]PQJ77856.1 tRNA (adenosine(37)-N6)-threonylcarbamoyltransferase complex ATPase subunit type 1 TsaE [Polaribacter porphyrae]